MKDNKVGQSFSALNWLNFFAADVATGVGPFLAVYLTANLHWSAGNIGLAIAAMSFATVLAQSPAGYIIDSTPYKKGIIIAASCTMGMIGISIPYFAHFNWIIIAQIIMGIAAAFYGPTLIALATCLAKKEKFDSTITKNQTYNHAGNVASAVLIGVVGKYTNNEGVFYCLLVLAVMCTVSALYIRNEDIDSATPSKDDKARKEDKNERMIETKTLSIAQMFQNKPFLVFLIAAFIFHFANGAMLPLVGQELGMGKHENASLYMSACIIIAQLVMVPITYLCGLKVKDGRKWLLLIAFIVLPIRGVLYTLNSNAIYLVAVQILDGVAAGIFGGVSILVVSDLMGKSGKASLAQGILATAVGLGASLSNLVSGYIVEAEGFNFGFLSLSGLAVGALILLWTSMPETLNGK